MSMTISSALDQILTRHSIASVRNWLRSKGLTYSAATKAAMRKRVEGLIKKGSISVEDVGDGAIDLEEASAKRTFLYSVSNEPQNLAVIDTQLASLKVPLSNERSLASSPTAKPKLVYAINSSTEFRAKWTELHTHLFVNRKTEKFDHKPVPKVVVCILNKQTGIVQLRYDAPSDKHIHTVEAEPNDKAYYGHYKSQVEAMLGLPLTTIDLHSKLESILRKVPRVVKTSYVVDETSEGGVNRRTQKQKNKDVRDLSDFPKTDVSGGSLVRTFEEAPVYWLKEPSSDELKREVYSYIYAAEGMVRFNAHCQESEIAYVLAQLV
jgi:hypothetical protein